MKRFLMLVVVVLVLAIVWRVSSRLSADAIGLAIGVVFGVLAGLPAAVLIVAANRRRRDSDGQETPSRHRGQNGTYHYGGYPAQPPVIVLAHPAAQPKIPNQPEHPVAESQLRALPPPMDEPRQFRIIGEPGEFDEEYA